MLLPTAAELATTIKAEFDADIPHTSAWDKTPRFPFVAGGVKDEKEKAFEKAVRDGLFVDKADFLAWTEGTLSYILRWSVKKGDPYAALFYWLTAWQRAVGPMETISGSNLLNKKPGNPYFRNFVKTYPLHDAYWHNPGRLLPEILNMDHGADIVEFLKIT